MGFSTNYEDVQDFDLIPKGEYEVIITKIEERTTQNGATGLNFTLVIRNDVEQKYQNRCIFHTLWKRKEPTQADMQVQEYSFKQIMQLAKAVRLPSGMSCISLECKHVFKTAVTSDTVAERPTETFVSNSFDDYEEILSDGDVPF